MYSCFGKLRLLARSPAKGAPASDGELEPLVAEHPLHEHHTGLLKRALAADLQGQVELSFDQDGVRCRISAPADKICSTDDAAFTLADELVPRPDAA